VEWLEKRAERASTGGVPSRTGTTRRSRSRIAGLLASPYCFAPDAGFGGWAIDESF
jgi:hypothetical protein